MGQLQLENLLEALKPPLESHRGFATEDEVTRTFLAEFFPPHASREVNEE